MRANPDQVLAGGYAVSNFRALPIAHHLNRSGSHSKNYPDCSQISCTSVQLRDYDLGSWRAGFPMTLEDISADTVAMSGDLACPALARGHNFALALDRSLHGTNNSKYGICLLDGRYLQDRY